MTCRSAIRLFVSALALSAIACGGATTSTDENAAGSEDDLSVKSSFVSHGTGYYPSSSQLEGGFVDRQGKKLHTPQEFLAGSAPYVAVAMDSSAFSYGTRLRINELEAKYGRAIVFRVVDTGGAFRGRGRARIDVCTANRSASLDPTINGALHIDVMDESGSGSGSGSGASCSGDGSCNPGSQGSGQICVSSHCVSGCRSNAQCPGNSTCQSGQCR